MKKRGPVSLNDKIAIVHQVLVKHEKQAEVARSFRMTPQNVAQIMLKAKRNPGFMREMLSRRDSKEAARQQIKLAVEVKNDFRCVIDSAKAVAEELQP